MSAKRKANITPKSTANFANQLLKAKSIGKSDPFFSVTIVRPKEDPFWKKLTDQLHDAIKEKYGKLPKKIRDWPIKDGNDTEYADWQDCFYFAPKRFEVDGRPQMVNADLEEIMDPAEIYSGMECRVSYRCAAWQFENKTGVSVYMDNVQKTNDGDPIGRVAPKAVDDFAAGMDDEDEDDTDGDENDMLE